MRFTERTWLALAATLLITGCASHEGSATTPAASATAPAASAGAAPAAAAGDGRCHAEGAQYTVGLALNPALVEQARQRSGSQLARAIGPTDAITMDYRAERLSLYLDATGKVTRASCG